MSGKNLRKRKRRSLVENHYNIDEATFRLLGALGHSKNTRRDIHDVFNIIMLPVILCLDCMNWDWTLVFSGEVFKDMAAAWTGDYFDLFFKTAMLYFVVDLLWVLLVKDAVKSPMVIAVHHLVVIFYVALCAPLRPFAMGACLSVELNTWFLILRRMVNKSGRPFTLAGIELKFTSVMFYFTWVTIRLILYPFMIVSIYHMWIVETTVTGTKFNRLALAVICQIIFTIMNFKWTVDLIISKMKARGPDKGL